MTADFLRNVSPHATFAMLNKSVIENFQGPQRERLLWERARIADGMNSQFGTLQQLPAQPLPSYVESLITWATDGTACNTPFGDCSALDTRASSSMPGQLSMVKSLYEDLLFEFPLGFYADAVRERLRELEQRLPG